MEGFEPDWKMSPLYWVKRSNLKVIVEKLLGGDKHKPLMRVKPELQSVHLKPEPCLQFLPNMQSSNDGS